MSKGKKRAVCLAAGGVFVLLLIRGLWIPAQGEGIPTGGANAPAAVFVSAVIGGLIAWVVMEGLFWLMGKIKQRKNKENSGKP